MISNNYDINLEFQNFEYCWCQGSSALKEGQQSVLKIAELLKLNCGSSLSGKDVLKIMMKKLGHLNGISTWKLKNLIRDDIQ